MAPEGAHAVWHLKLPSHSLLAMAHVCGSLVQTLCTYTFVLKLGGSAACRGVLGTLVGALVLLGCHLGSWILVRFCRRSKKLLFIPQASNGSPCYCPTPMTQTGSVDIEVPQVSVSQ